MTIKYCNTLLVIKKYSNSNLQLKYTMRAAHPIVYVGKCIILWEWLHGRSVTMEQFNKYFTNIGSSLNSKLPKTGEDPTQHIKRNTAKFFLGTH